MTADYTVLIDKREKLPYTFSKTTKLSLLESGDYSIDGFENKIALERKSLNDFVNSLILPRFFAELKRLQKFDLAAIIVEGSIEELLEHKYDSPSIEPNSVIGLTISILIDYHIPILFCGSRQHGLYMTEKILTMYYEHYIKKDNKEFKIDISKEIKSNKVIRKSKSQNNNLL